MGPCNDVKTITSKAMSAEQKTRIDMSKSITRLHLGHQQQKQGFLARWIIGHKPLLTPAVVPLDLIFFRRIFSNLYKNHGNGNNEVPISVFQRSVVRLFRVLGMKEVNFNAEEYDVDGSGAVGWYEFVTCWRRSQVSINLTVPEQIFLAIEDPGSCLLGQITSIAITALIFISCFCFILGTLPDFKHSSSDCPSCEPEQLALFDLLEAVCIGVFTVEYVVRVLTAPFSRTELLDYEKILEFVTEHDEMRIPSRWVRLLRFLTEPMNCLDLLVILPFYAEMAMGTRGSNLTVLRVLRLTRLFRLVKLGRYFEILQIIVRVFRRSLRALYVLLFYLVLGVCFSAAAMYIVEGGTWDAELQDYIRVHHDDGVRSVSPFKSIPHSFWWCIVTYTTTGYGDDYPVTVYGKLVAACTMLVGIMVLAMPISVISLNFSEVWQEWNEEKRLETEAAEQDLISVAKALESIESRTHLLIELFDEQRGHQSSEFLGEVNFQKLPVDRVVRVSGNECLSLQGNEEKRPRLHVEGTLRFSYVWIPKDNTAKGDIDGRLEVKVHGAEGIRRSDWKTGGYRDLYAVVHCWPKPPATLHEEGVTSAHFRTKTTCNTLVPLWEEATTFHFRWPADWRASDLDDLRGAGSPVRTPVGGEAAGSRLGGWAPSESGSEAVKTPDGSACSPLLPRGPRSEREPPLHGVVEQQGRELRALARSMTDMQQMLRRIEALLGAADPCTGSEPASPAALGTLAEEGEETVCHARSAPGHLALEADAGSPPAGRDALAAARAVPAMKRAEPEPPVSPSKTEPQLPGVPAPLLEEGPLERELKLKHA